LALLEAPNAIGTTPESAIPMANITRARSDAAFINAHPTLRLGVSATVTACQGRFAFPTRERTGGVRGRPVC
jgi:hypothetical protein